MPQFGTAAVRIGGSAGSPSTVSKLNRNPAILTPSLRWQPVARYDNPHASDIAARLQEALKEADSAELRALVYERLPTSL
jgi:hypothetical protein